MTIRVGSRTGHHLIDGSAVAWAWAAADEPADEQQVIAAINKAVFVMSDRRADRDVGFGLRQLVDVTVKAIAPSVNDSYTAVQAVQHLSVVVVALAHVRTDHHRWLDEAGDLRVFAPVVPFEQHLETVCSHIRRSAANRPRVAVALLRMLETVAASETSDARRKAVAHQIELIVHDTKREIMQPADLEPVTAMANAALHAAKHGEVVPFAADLTGHEHS